MMHPCTSNDNNNLITSKKTPSPKKRN